MEMDMTFSRLFLLLLLAAPVCAYAEGGPEVPKTFGVSSLLGTSAPSIAAKMQQVAGQIPMTGATAAMNAEVDRVFDPRRQAPPMTMPPPAPPQQQGNQIISLNAVSFPRQPLPPRPAKDELKATLERVHDVLQPLGSTTPVTASSKTNVVQELQQVESRQGIALINSPRLDAQMPAEALGPGTTSSSDWGSAKHHTPRSDLEVYSTQSSSRHQGYSIRF